MCAEVLFVMGGGDEIDTVGIIRDEEEEEEDDDDSTDDEEAAAMRAEVEGKWALGGDG